jgi:p-cumate 2,3-dioxygenase ferredoxin component
MTALCPEADVADGAIKQEMLEDGTLVALYRVEGRIYATADTCTHGGSSLSEEGRLEGHIIECAWHSGRFDIRTGEVCASPCTVPLRTYAVSIVGGMVHIEA